MSVTGARVVVGLSGASGAALGIRVVELLHEAGAEVHLIVSRAAQITLAHEAGGDALPRLRSLVAKAHRIDDVAATIASGSFGTRGMIVAPCSIRSLSAIACGLSDNLLVRAADVHLKERRPLVLAVRESPLHLGHLRSMAAVAELGAVVAPPLPAFYAGATDLADVVDHIARRTVGHLGPDFASHEEWRGLD